MAQEEKSYFPIDLVYTWVDGSDETWKDKRNKTIGGGEADSAKNCEGRYKDNDELKFSLRSVEKYAPWIRKIHIITDSQIPSWLDISNPRIQIVDHKEIMSTEYLPTFNSVVIEHALHKVPDLAEHFLYANDDTFLNQPVEPSNFFNQEGWPIVRMIRRPFRRRILSLKRLLLKGKKSYYNDTLINASNLVNAKYGRWYGCKPHHNIDAYRRSLYQKTIETFDKEIKPTLKNRQRGDDDIQRVIYSYLMMAEGKCSVEYVGRKTSFRLRNHKRNYYGKMEKLQPMLFCLNDSQYATDEDRRIAREFLENLFPIPSSFESGR